MPIPHFFAKTSHVYIPAIIAYLSSFVLVKYSEISVPTSEEAVIGSPGPEATTTTPGDAVGRPQSDNLIRLRSLGQKATTNTPDPIIAIERVYLRNLFRTRPISPASAFSTPSSTPGTVTAPELQDAYNVLLRCNSVCVTLTFVGLLFALIGIMAYVWTAFTLVPGIFVSVCLIVSLASACYALR